MKFRFHIAPWLICASVVGVGCSSSEIQIATPAPATSPSEPVTTAPTATLAGAPHTPDLADPKKATAVAAQFTPAFPERHDMFAVKQAQGNVRRDEEKGESVELKGFINVDVPRVILSIDGVISPVPEGGEKYGVQVLSIQPPSVVLKRGRDRWTAKLE